MRIRDTNWMMIEQYLTRDDRAVIPIGCTEQHAYLSLAVDAILAENVAAEAADPLGVPVFPAIPFGHTPTFMAYPGTVSLRLDTLIAVVRDVLDSLATHGFKRILIVNGHGGNAPIGHFLGEWMADHPTVKVKFHNWWNSPRTWAKVIEIDPVASHASWMENFRSTRIDGVKQPEGSREPVDYVKLKLLNPVETRAYLGDGNFAGVYEKPDAIMDALWQVAVEETRELIETNWGGDTSTH
ncbi:MAG: creatininase family protein [Aeromicrobium sp.]|nr:creatininase family protein [Burkholderiales bacterium]